MAVVAVGSCATSRRSLLTACEPVFSEHRVESCTLAMSIFWVGMSQEKVFHVDGDFRDQKQDVSTCPFLKKAEGLVSAHLWMPLIPAGPDSARMVFVCKGK